MAVMTHHLVGPAEVGEMLGVSRQRVDQIARDDPKFPKPEAELATGRVWKRAAIEKWAKGVGRTVK
jgi:predicted DNA-binding transcriptional regulator AlpA